MSALITAARNPNFAAEIVLVVSDMPGAAGLLAALEAGVGAILLDFRSFARKEAFEDELERALRAAGVELICLAGFMRILTPRFVAPWRSRILNIHPSLLPDFRGLHTHQRVLAEGRREHGCTVHYVVGKLDAGPIIAQTRVPVFTSDDVPALAARVLAEEHRIYPRAVDAIARSLARSDCPPKVERGSENAAIW
ncbi:MAG: phosphoribosylglycinamide formyltransferase [Hyphomicrobiales bacterium]|nr:phosphoribosylglycinamide formyltransferase [Hyphomicrobiales bacterium]